MDTKEKEYTVGDASNDAPRGSFANLDASLVFIEPNTCDFGTTCSTVATHEGIVNSPTHDWESQGVIDWSTLKINDLADEDDEDVVMEEDAMYKFVGLRAEDDKREREARLEEDLVANPLAHELQEHVATETVGMKVDDNTIGEPEYIIDQENPTMTVGDT
ncbi:hypothetical protein GUJ93_ZPchr0002g23937 [Zizania palustris]|uniref:Uncharacterized protein n=1 Tax=Zizania palustris TaxID=103762 RepID=A0A8J5VWS2_ZIZPA|nr:hypothetical protein GUJ93_ZPchr0002g23937 [Zizania palustris]